MNKKQNIIKVIQFILCVILLCALFYSIYKTVGKQQDRPTEIHTEQTSNIPLGVWVTIEKDENGQTKYEPVDKLTGVPTYIDAIKNAKGDVIGIILKTEEQTDEQ